MKVTIEEVIKGEYFPDASYIDKEDKRIVFSFTNKDRGTIKVHVVGQSQYGKMGLTVDVSLIFLEQTNCIDWLVMEWEAELKRKVKSGDVPSKLSKE